MSTDARNFDPEVDQHMSEVLGVAPDDRERIPLAEQTRAIQGVQAGESGAFELLLSQRFGLLRNLVNRAELKQSHGLDLDDMVVLGAAAIFEAAREVDLDAKVYPSTQLHNGAATKFKSLIGQEGVFPEDTELIPDGSTLRPFMDVDEREYAPEAHTFENDFLRSMRKRVSSRGWKALCMRFGLYGGKESTLDEVGRAMDITREGARFMLANILAEVSELNAYSDLYTVEQTNRGLSPPQPSREKRWDEEVAANPRLRQWLDRRAGKLPRQQWSPEQIARQQAWLQDISEKQDRGEITFVKGSLLKRPLPAEIQTFLDRGSYEYNFNYRLLTRGDFNFGGELKRILDSLSPETQKAKQEAERQRAEKQHARRIETLQARTRRLEAQLAETRQELANLADGIVE